MNIAELFVSLGVKGSEKTIGSLTSMKKGLSDTAAMSLEAKAAIVGAFYALERLFSASGRQGTDLTNFNALLGVSAKTLQQYQYAARQAGVSNQETESTFKSLQQTMTKTLMGEGAPKGLAQVARLTGGLTAQDIQKFAQQPQLLIQKLQEYASKESNAGLRNEVLKSFGVSDGIIAAMTRKAFTPQNLAKAPTYSDKEVGALDKANIAWSNLGNKIEMAVGHFNAKHGGELVKDLSQLTDRVLKLADAFMKLAESAKFFERIKQATEGWVLILDGLTSTAKVLAELFSSDFATRDKASDKVIDTTTDIVKTLPGFFGEMLSEMFGDKPDMKSKVPAGKTTTGAPGLRLVPPVQTAPGTNSIAPPVSAVGGPNSTQNIEVNQNLNFNHDGKDVKRTGDSTKKAVHDAFRSLSAQGQGS